MTLKLRQLETLRAVIECGSVTEAAERLRVSQPAVSKMVQQTEAQLGYELFVRDRGRLLPTPEARLLLPEIARATAAVEAVHLLAADLQGQRAGLLSLATVPTLGNSLLRQVIADFSVARPGVRIVIEMMVNHEVVAAVAGNGVDLGVVLDPAEDTATAARDLCGSDLVCLLPSGHPLAARDSLGPADLQGHPLISFSRHQPIGALIDGAFRDAGLRRSVAIEVNQSWHACLLVQSGAGLAVLDGFTGLGTTLSGVEVRPFLPRVRITARLLTARHRPLSQLARSFIADLDAAVAAHIDRGALFPAGTPAGSAESRPTRMHGRDGSRARDSGAASQ